jgi:acetyl esterase/lipase
MSNQEPPYDGMPSYEDIFRERGEALNACLVLVGERDRLRTENATLRELVRETYGRKHGAQNREWYERAEKVLAQKEGPEGP